MTTATCALDIVLDDIPPSLNNIYRTITIKGISRRVLSGAAKKWKADATKIMRVAGSRQGWSIDPKRPFAIVVRYTAPNVLVWDLDGKPKLLIDAFCEAFGVDDRYLMALNQEKQRGQVAQLRMRVIPLETI